MAKENGQQVEKRERTPEERQQAIQRASDDMEQVVAECGIVALSQVSSPLLQTIKLADGMSRMRALMPQSVVERYFMPLQGTPLGFVTDKDKDGGYGWEVVRDVVVEGLMRGFRPIGNEINIIAGRFYGAKAGFERIVREFPGVHDFQFVLGVPTLVGNGGALVEFDATWIYHGERQEMTGRAAGEGTIDTRISVRVNGGMGPDAILGKATRKLCARVYQRLTGCSRDIVEMDPSDYVDAGNAGTAKLSGQPEGRRMKLGAAPLAQPASEPHNDAPAEPMRDPGEEG